MLRKGCNKASERFDNMTEVAEFWHAKQAFLSVSDSFYKTFVKYIISIYFYLVTSYSLK